MGTITDRNSKDLTEAEEIKRRLRGDKNTQKKCWGKKKNLNDPDNHNGAVTHQSHTSWSVKSNGS